MRITLIAHITGTRNGVDWPALGETIDVPDSEAADLIGSRLAVEAPAEKAVMAQRETAEAKRPTRAKG